MNTRMQDLFMNPAFRTAIYSLPLSEGTLENATTYVKGGKRKMLLEIQRLFVMLQSANRRSYSTESLTQSFGWGQGEGMQQQDVHEFNRVLFDAIEQALKGTDKEHLIDDMFFGSNAGYLRCNVCSLGRDIPEKFLDISC